MGLSLFLGRPTRILIAGLALFALHGCGGEAAHRLRVDLITDFMPAIEFDTVRVSFGEGDSRESIDHIVDPSRDYVDGIVLGVAQVPSSTQNVEVSLFEDGVPIIVRRVSVVVRTPVIATVIITRDCRGVSCPGSGDPLLSSCLGGQCADPRCTVETPEFCAAGECLSADDCASHVCARTLCRAGVCLFDPDDSRCGAGQRCDISRDCVDEEADAGVADSGMRDAPADTFDGGPDVPDVPMSDAPVVDVPDVFDAGPPPPGCPVVDEDTIFLYDFESDEDAVANVVGILHENAYRAASSSPCGGSVLLTPGPEPAQSRFVVPDQAAFHLAEGSFDFWVRNPSATRNFRAGLLSRDAMGSDESGHLTLFSDGNGRLALRGQMGVGSEVVLCSAFSVPQNVWHRIGVNFGPDGLDFYLDGVLQTETGTARILPTPFECDTTTIPFSLAGTTNPFVLGASSHNSSNGTDVPADFSGAGWQYDHFRFSRVQRDYAAGL